MDWWAASTVKNRSKRRPTVTSSRSGAVLEIAGVLQHDLQISGAVFYRVRQDVPENTVQGGTVQLPDHRRIWQRDLRRDPPTGERGIETGGCLFYSGSEVYGFQDQLL